MFIDYPIKPLVYPHNGDDTLQRLKLLPITGTSSNECSSHTLCSPFCTRMWWSHIPKRHFIFCVFERWAIDRVKELSSFRCGIPSSGSNRIEARVPILSLFAQLWYRCPISTGSPKCRLDVIETDVIVCQYEYIASRPVDQSNSCLELPSQFLSCFSFVWNTCGLALCCCCGGHWIPGNCYLLSYSTSANMFTATRRRQICFISELNL